MSEGGWSTGLNLQPRQRTSSADTALYLVDDHALDAFGFKLVAGRGFKPEEAAEVNFGDRLQPASIIVTRALADKLFPAATRWAVRSTWTRTRPPAPSLA